MLKYEQTDEVKIRLFHLTRQFVYKYVHKYYKQYHGDLEDLVFEYYTSFLTEKSREKGKEESLLDKYDPKVTSFEYLVKIAVTRKLIDSSRSNPYSVFSIEKMHESYGDMMTRVLGLTTEDEEHLHRADSEIPITIQMECCSRWDMLDEEIKLKIYEQYEEVQNILAPAFKKMFSSVFQDYQKPVVEPQFFDMVLVLVTQDGVKVEVPCQQVTEKTACVFYNGDVLDFNRFTGESRRKAYEYLHLAKESVDYIKENIKDVFKSGYSRREFISMQVGAHARL